MEGDPAALGEDLQRRSHERLRQLRNLRRIGSGRYGNVYEAYDEVTGRTIAVKSLKEESSQCEGVSPSCIREAALLKTCDHPNIVSLLDVVVHRDKVYLLLEKMGLDLSSWLGNLPVEHASPVPGSKGVRLSVVQQVLQQILQSLLFCHDNDILHRDLKTGNVLIDPDTLLVKVCDFGLSRLCGECGTRPLTSEVITLWYRCPEVLLGDERYTSKVDVWSAGCILGELMTGVPLFRGANVQTQLKAIYASKGVPDASDYPFLASLPEYGHSVDGLMHEDHIPESGESYAGTSFARLHDTLHPLAWDLLDKLLHYEPKERISCEDALQHEFFQADFAGYEEDLVAHHPPPPSASASS